MKQHTNEMGDASMQWIMICPGGLNVHDIINVQMTDHAWIRIRRELY